MNGIIYHKRERGKSWEGIVVNLFDNVNGVKQIKSYISLLDGYKKVLEKYQKKVDLQMLREEDKVAAAQTAIDFTNFKNEMNQIKENQEQLIKELSGFEEHLQEIASTQREIEEKYKNIDSLIIEPIKKNYTANKMAVNEQLEEVMDLTKKKSRGVKLLMGILLVCHLISIAGITSIVLYLLDIIQF